MRSSSAAWSCCSPKPPRHSPAGPGCRPQGPLSSTGLLSPLCHRPSQSTQTPQPPRDTAEETASCLTKKSCTHACVERALTCFIRPKGNNARAHTQKKASGNFQILETQVSVRPAFELKGANPPSRLPLRRDARDSHELRVLRTRHLSPAQPGH